MTELLTEIGFIVALLLANGVFAMSEMAIVSARRARLQQRAAEGHAGARIALDLSAAPAELLSTVQIGITLIGIVAGAFGGASLSKLLAPWFEAIPAVAPYSEPLAFGLVVVAITFLSLVIGELVPKRIALSAPERIASLVAAPMRGLSRLASPVVKMLGFATELILRILRVKPMDDTPVSEEEIKIMVEQATKAGVLEMAEHDIVKNVFRFGDLRVSAIMTPRSEIVWLDASKPLEENLPRVAASHHSYFPVCQGSQDAVLGMISVKALWACAEAGKKPDLTDALLKPLYVPQSMPGLRLLEVFKQTRRHIALVIDEYGGVQGIVTLIDVLEALVGDIPTAEGPRDEMIVKRQDGSWLLDGLVPVGRFKEIFKLKTLPGEGRNYFHTLGGFVMMHLGRIPSVADRFEWDGYTFEVVDMDGNRVDKVLVTPRDKSKLPPQKA